MDNDVGEVTEGACDERRDVVEVNFRSPPRSCGRRRLRADRGTRRSEKQVPADAARTACRDATRGTATRGRRVAQRDMRMRLVQTRHVELRTSIGMSSTSS
jgi:hypothetical protein